MAHLAQQNGTRTIQSGVPKTGSERRDGQSSPPSENAYTDAVVRHGSLIESCAEVVLRQLVAESRPKTSRFHRSGNQLDLRVAMQFEADPRQCDRLFQRRSLPTHPDPAFILVVDESGSMAGKRAESTFDAVVVLREVCLRLGIMGDIPVHCLGLGPDSHGLTRIIPKAAVGISQQDRVACRGGFGGSMHCGKQSRRSA